MTPKLSLHGLPALPDASSPDGSAEIRYLLQSPRGDLTHAVCPAGVVASVHELPELYEAYYLLAGRGEIWRRTGDREGVTALRPGRWVEMPPGTQFQYRAYDEAALVFLLMVLPTWQRDLFHTAAGGIWPVGRAASLPPTPAGECVDGWMSGDLSVASDYLAPDGSEIRLLSGADRGSLAHCTLHPWSFSSPVRHRTVYEIWYVVEGHGELWRSHPDSGESVAPLWSGVSADIPTGAAFQFRSTGVGPLKLVLLTMPKWPGPDEAVPAGPGRWQ